jgi:hypothetical protein
VSSVWVGMRSSAQWKCTIDTKVRVWLKLELRVLSNARDALEKTQCSMPT